MSLTSAFPMFETSRFSSDNLLKSMASLLTEMCTLNDQVRIRNSSPLTKFHSVCAAPISILDYLIRVRRYSTCSNCCFVVALIYLDRAQRNASIVVDSLNVHRLIITSIMIASKFYEDRIQRNSVYAQIGGICSDEMNGLEIELLNSLGFQMDVTPEEFDLYETALIVRHSKETTVTPQTPETASFTSAPHSSPVLSASSSPLSQSSMDCDAVSPASEIGSGVMYFSPAGGPSFAAQSAVASHHQFQDPRMHPSQQVLC